MAKKCKVKVGDKTVDGELIRKGAKRTRVRLDPSHMTDDLKKYRRGDSDNTTLVPTEDVLSVEEPEKKPKAAKEEAKAEATAA